MSDRTILKDAETGRIVSQAYAEAHPDTTYAATIATPDRLTEALDAIEAAGWDWTLNFHREPERMPVGTHRYELEAWRQPAGYLRLGGPTKPEAAEAVLAAIADLSEPEPEPAEEPVTPEVVSADPLDVVVSDEVEPVDADVPVVEPIVNDNEGRV